MRTVFLILTAQLIIGCGDRLLECGTEVVDRRYYTEHYWNKELVPYIDDYLALSNSRGIETSIVKRLTRVEYGEINSGSVVGYCRTNTSFDGGIYKTITIKEKYEFDEYEMKALMMHELGHCIHNLDHSIRPGAIMYGVLPGEEFLKDTWEDRVEEFFDFLFNGDTISGELM